MVAVQNASLKTVHVIGDSHALGFKGRSVIMPEYGFVFNTSVEYVRGLTADKLIVGQKLLPDLASYFLRSGVITREGIKAAATRDALTITEQYSTGAGFQRPIVIFTAGEISVRNVLELASKQAGVGFADMHARLNEIVKKYFADIRAIQGSFGIFPVVHEVCPPTADDARFEVINKFRCPRELRATVSGLFNQLLLEHAFKHGIALCRSADYLAVDGCLSAEYEFDGVHADPKFVYTSLERAVSAWLHVRTSEKSERYLCWCDAVVGMAEKWPITRLGVSDVFSPFSATEIAALRGALGNFDAAVCRRPALDWAHLPPTERYDQFNSHIRYGDISRQGLTLLRDVLIKGPVATRLRDLIGTRYSIINVRPVHSSPHGDAGIGQQSLHLDGCPPGVFRSLIYLSDVDDEAGPFEYIPVGGGTTPVQVTGKAGSMIVFDANAVWHRATPPRSRERLALDLILLAQPASCTELVDCRPGFTWPVDPYMFSVSDSAVPPLKGNQWFYPALIAPKPPADDVQPARAAG